MGRFVFKLPDVGEGTAEAELVGWHVKIGDTVSEDQIVADVMTDKATVEITAPVSGKVVALHGEPGAMVPVRGPLVEFEVEGAGNAEESPSVSPLRSEPPPPATRGEETVAASSPPHASGEAAPKATEGADAAPTGNHVFKLPDVGEGTAEAELVGWHVKVGDAVEEDQILAEVMTDKATVEITSPVAGVVVALHGEPGKAVPVGGPLVSFNVAGKGNVAAPAPAPSVASPKGGGSTP
ncbi:biotin/lipoyl-containing protein, partial [Brevundimonas sp.]|uniref:biotin/lipoyl-containing protein n=2 Tax=Brevundimonas TaxID=41275 RepID=UPI00257C05FE